MVLTIQRLSSTTTVQCFEYTGVFVLFFIQCDGPLVTHALYHYPPRATPLNSAFLLVDSRGETGMFHSTQDLVCVSSNDIHVKIEYNAHICTVN